MLESLEKGLKALGQLALFAMLALLGLVITSIMYAPVVFFAFFLIEIILPKSLKMGKRIGDYAALCSLILGLIAWIIAINSINGIDAMPFYEYLNEQAEKGSTFIYVYIISGCFFMFGGFQIFNNWFKLDNKS